MNLLLPLILYRLANMRMCCNRTQYICLIIGLCTIARRKLYYNSYDTAYESESHMKHGDVRVVLEVKKAEHERITSLSLILLYKDID